MFLLFFLSSAPAKKTISLASPFINLPLIIISLLMKANYYICRWHILKIGVCNEGEEDAFWDLKKGGGCFYNNPSKYLATYSVYSPHIFFLVIMGGEGQNVIGEISLKTWEILHPIRVWWGKRITTGNLISIIIVLP